MTATICQPSAFTDRDILGTNLKHPKSNNEGGAKQGLERSGETEEDTNGEWETEDEDDLGMGSTEEQDDMVNCAIIEESTVVRSDRDIGVGRSSTSTCTSSFEQEEEDGFQQWMREWLEWDEGESEAMENVAVISEANMRESSGSTSYSEYGDWTRYKWMQRERKRMYERMGREWVEEQRERMERKQTDRRKRERKRRYERMEREWMEEQREWLERMERERTDRREREEQEEQEEQEWKAQILAMWTTPGLRPLAEPLIPDWDWFFREKIPTDGRYKALFPDDVEKRSRIKDVVGEREALAEYSCWALMMKDDPDDPQSSPKDIRDKARRKFYGELHTDLNTERVDVDTEFDELYASAGELCRWEFTFLDDDGVKTKRVEEFLEKGADIFEGWGNDVTEKYGHLKPPGYKKNQLATFEWHLLDRDGGVTRLKGMLRGGDDFFLKWHDKEIVRKYGHLRSNLADFARRGVGTKDNLDKYGRLRIRDPDIYYEQDGQVKVRCTPRE